MKWWGMVLGMVLVLVVGTGCGWFGGDASEETEGGKPKVENATPAPSAPGEKDEPVYIAETCGALRAACEQNMPGDARCAMLEAECQTALAACPECKAGEDPNAVAECLANCKKQCEDKVAKKPKVKKRTAGGGHDHPKPEAFDLAPRIVWRCTTNLDGKVNCKGGGVP